MTRILVLTNQYPPHHLGGYELSCRDVVDRWKRAGIDVQVLTGDWRRAGVGDPDEPHVHRRLTFFLGDDGLWSPPLRHRLGVERANERALSEELAWGPDVVSVWHMGALPTGLLRVLEGSGLPVVFVVCDDWPTYATAIDPWMRMWSGHPVLARLAGPLLGAATTLPDLDRMGEFCFVSETTRRRCRAHSTLRFPRSTVTYSGIDHEDFPVRGLEGARSEWKGRLLVVGRLDPRKGFETAIRAAALLPGTTLDVVCSGGGPYREALDRLVVELGIADRVRFRTAARHELAGVYGSADVLLFTPEWDEPFGLVPIESMACATPVVATAAGGSAEFLEDGRNCLTVPPGDPAAVAAAVQRLASDPGLRSTLVAGGTGTASRYSVDRLADVLTESHLRAVGDRPVPSGADG
ncbi:MAG TPA: glycosyltransferase family 4 protein [Acidimicrobiales bacterium]|nr:glycosyltransferase family 4 protein [Acidimicrobiales bacterium]